MTTAVQTILSPSICDFVDVILFNAGMMKEYSSVCSLKLKVKDEKYVQQRVIDQRQASSGRPATILIYLA